METRNRKKTRKNRGKLSLLLIPLAAVLVGLAVWGPEELAKYRDNGILNQIQAQETRTGTEGYRYSLGSNEKIYILSKCLNNQILPESEQNAMTRGDLDYENLTGIYAFVANKKDASGQDVEESAGIRLANQGIRELKDLGVLPVGIQELTESSYSAVLYSAIDVPDPQNNVLVWKINLDTSLQNANKENRLLDAYVDADTGKIYEFYARTQIASWEAIWVLA